MRLFFPEGCDVWVARGATALFIALAGALILRLPAPLPRGPTPDETVLVVEFLPPRRAPRRLEPRPVPQQPRQPRQPRVEPALRVVDSHEATPAEAPVDEPVERPRATPAPVDEPAPVAFIPRAGNAEAFGRRGPDPLEVTPRTSFNIQDRSLGGRLRAMTKRSDCAELRAALRKGGSDVDAIVRTMQDRGCI